jgi:hypothetical protein
MATGSAIGRLSPFCTDQTTAPPQPTSISWTRTRTSAIRDTVRTAAATVDVNGCSQGQFDGDLDGYCDPSQTSTLCIGATSASNNHTSGLDLDGVGDDCDPDVDGDGVANGSDLCALTPVGAVVDANGCSQAQVDSDNDGVCNAGAPASFCTGSDLCPSTGPAAPVDANGCADAQVDADGDGVCNASAPSASRRPAPAAIFALRRAAASRRGRLLGREVDGDGDSVCDTSAPPADRRVHHQPLRQHRSSHTSGRERLLGPGSTSTPTSLRSAHPLRSSPGLDLSRAAPSRDVDGGSVGDTCDVYYAPPRRLRRCKWLRQRPMDQDGDGICDPAAPSTGPASTCD